MTMCGEAIWYWNPGGGGTVECELPPGHRGDHDAPSQLLLRPEDTIRLPGWAFTDGS